MRSGVDRQFHCHDHVPWSSCTLDAEPAAGCDTGADAGVPVVELAEPALAVVGGAVSVVAEGAGDALDVATFTWVTGPLSPGSRSAR